MGLYEVLQRKAAEARARNEQRMKALFGDGNKDQAEPGQAAADPSGRPTPKHGQSEQKPMNFVEVLTAIMPLVEKGMRLAHQYDPVPPPLPPHPPLSPLPRHTAELTEAVRDYYTPDRGRFTSWWQRGKAESRTKLLSVLTEEQMLVIQNGALLEEAVRNNQKSESDYYRYLAQNANVIYELRAREALINNALRRGHTLETDQHLKQAHGEAQIRILEEEAKSSIKVEAHERLQAVDLEARWAETMQDLQAADLAEIGEHTIIQSLRGDLTKARRERYALKVSDEPEELKQELVADYDVYIANLEAHIHERETGRLQNPPRGKQKRRTSKHTRQRTDYPPETDQDSV